VLRSTQLVTDFLRQAQSGGSALASGSVTSTLTGPVLVTSAIVERCADGTWAAQGQW
jgi:hypothetical protein